VTPAIIVIILAVLAMTGVYVSWRAGRLDRLHTRLETARASLDVALVRRSSVTLELASSGLLDPATSLLLAGLAHDARSARTDRELAESDLTKALRTVFSQPGFRASVSQTSVSQTRRAGADELLAELEATAHQVFLARTFYNDAVVATVAARRRPLARALRLAGGAPMPEFFEIEDSLAPGGTGSGKTEPPAGGEAAAPGTGQMAADCPPAPIADTPYDGNRRPPTTTSTA
jgi:hypothetical protein